MTFLDIFSKKPIIPSNSNIRIIIDNREKNSLVPSHLKSLGFSLEFKQLPVADYIIGNTAIERKTISDFKSSIINKRIMSQLLELKQYPNPILILEGIESEDIYEGVLHENAFRGFLLSIIQEYKVPIIFTLNEKDTAKYLSVLAKKSPKSESSIRPTKFLLSKKEQLQFILEGFPQIGPTTAKKLLKHFKTLNSLANASEQELKDLIGKKSELLYSLLHFKYK
jgi:ERCC4-type nuclease